MTKQIPLRLDDETLEMLEKLKKHYSVNTTNKMIIEMIKSHLDIDNKLKEANLKISALNLKLNFIKEYWSNMKKYESLLAENLE